MFKYVIFSSSNFPPLLRIAHLTTHKVKQSGSFGKKMLIFGVIAHLCGHFQ